MSGNETGKFIALVLRHIPDVIGITLEEHGWANVEEQGLMPQSRYPVLD